MPVKILIIRFSSIGDIVLTTPVVRCLKQQLQAEVHFLTKKPFRNILDANPYVDKVYAIKSKISEIGEDLKSEQYDWVIDLHHNLRSFQAKLLLRTANRSFDKINFQKWLMVRFKWDVLPRTHIVNRYLDTVKKLGVQYDGQGLDYFIPEAQEVQLRNLAAEQNLSPELRNDLLHGHYIALVIGAAHATKRLPVKKLIEICQGIQQPVLLLGGPDDRPAAEQIIQASGPHVVNTCGKYSLHQSASLVRQAQQVITHDTGLMHIAAALRKPIISVWGNTIPEFGMTPFYPDGMEKNTTIEAKQLSCRPCSKIGFDACPKGHFKCMEQIDLEKIFLAIEPNTPAEIS
ncbi:MAG: glycosyltransferase family 9 protein [Haliscomenobacter sp.]|uniref:glycosyltransferase family 9 protein n=1 Tax=Haliscomenobacter sp. TaxID=2717303 RepID=UPI0029A7A7F2|nr:glycosyltransferase family 9 protein [Haliscomenobacter sp.]MDX2071771.1 glycosyltransferase family 9 protein [Haliscomenobacter sp.]